MKNWLPFEEALKVIRSDTKKYNIDSVNKWYDYCRSSKKPEGIVSCPHKFYKNKGWINWFHWLGKKKSYSRKKFLSFNESLKIIRKDSIQYKLTHRTWSLYSKTNRPINIPSNPQTTYRNKGWVSWQHWFGVNNGRNFKSFNNAFLYIEKDLKKYNIVTRSDWRKKYVETKIIPKDIPSCPDLTYKNKGWVSWNYWLRTDSVPKNKSLLGCSSELVEKYWDFDNNVKRPEKIGHGERIIINLKCDKGHKWLIPSYSLRKIKGCPYCLHKRIIKGESLGHKYPNLLKHWNYSKNKIDPYEIYGGSGKKIWMKCPKDHEWLKRIDHIVSRENGSDCPYCTHKLPSSNYNVAVLYPELIKDWLSTNKYKPENCLPASSKKIDWQCHVCNYRWTSRVADRALLEVRCPSCTKIRLKDGTLCDSMIEAYYCLLLKQSKVRFFQNHCYPGLRLRYDFYIPSLKLYIETTSYNGKEKWWNAYFEKINRKRKYVKEVLFYNFEFINRQLNSSEIRFVKSSMA